MCIITFRLPSSSALCRHTSRVVSLLLSAHQRGLRVDMPAGRDPRREEDVMRHVRAADGVFYQLPVSGVMASEG